MTVRKITSFDVARLAGVNQSTVSRALANDSRISVETRSRVRWACEKLGYIPNAIARSRMGQHTNMVGIVMTDITRPFQPHVLEKFIQKLQLIGKQALVFSAGPAQGVDDVLPLALQYRVDALIVATASLSSRRLADCARNDVRVILFNRYVPGVEASVVCCDNRDGGCKVADFLLAGGHRRLAFVAGDPDSSTNRDRMIGFADRMRESGNLPIVMEQATYTYEAGQEAASHLLGGEGDLDAVFCASDITALGFLDRARELGVKIPRELSVVGFGDIPMASWTSYSLTTVRQPVDEMIESTLEIVVKQEDSKPASPVIQLLPGTLIERQSTRSI